jgi:hypothetical protein
MKTCKQKTRNCKLFHKTSAATGLKLGMLGRTSGSEKENRKKIYNGKNDERRGRNIVREMEKQEIID